MNRFDAVRELVKDPLLRVTDIAKQTGYNKGHMDKKGIIRMAREAGWSGIYTQWREPDGSPDWTPVKVSLTVPVTMEQIKRFAVLVAAAEREVCAKVCDGMDHNGVMIAADCAAAIRARGEK